jgi:hypothetical protein
MPLFESAVGKFEKAAADLYRFFMNVVPDLYDFYIRAAFARPPVAGRNGNFDAGIGVLQPRMRRRASEVDVEEYADARGGPSGLARREGYA